MNNLFTIINGKILSSTGEKLPIAQVREILTAAVHTAQKATLEERKEEFAKKVAAWSQKHPGKYPKGFYIEFISHWTSVNDFSGLEEMKVELTLKEGGKTAVFDIGRRLAYWWGKLDQAAKNTYWANDEKKINEPKQGSLAI